MTTVELSNIGAYAKTAELFYGQVVIRDLGPPIDKPGEGAANSPRRCHSTTLTECEVLALRAAIDQWFPRAVAPAPLPTESLLIEMFVAGVPYPKGTKVQTTLPARCPGCKRNLTLKDHGICRLGPMLEQADMQRKSRPGGALAKWSKAIAEAAREHARAMASADDHEAVELELAFYMPRAVVKKGRDYPTIKPDADKLQRAVQDALQGSVYDDDSQVVRTIVTLLWADDEDRADGSREPGVFVRARTVAAKRKQLPLPPIEEEERAPSTEHTEAVEVEESQVG